MRNERIFESNLRALRIVYPEYAGVLSVVENTDRYRFAAEGEAYSCRDSRGRWLHGPGDPWQAARIDVASLVDGEPRLYVVLRPGLGYEALAILDLVESRGTGSIILVVEDRLDLWKAALGFTNWGPILQCPSAVLLLGKPEAVIDAFLTRHREIGLLPATIVKGQEGAEGIDCAALAERLQTRSAAVKQAVAEELRTADSLIQRRRSRPTPRRVILAGEHGYLLGPFAQGLRDNGCGVEVLAVPGRTPRNVRAQDFALKILRTAPDLVLWANRPELSQFGSRAFRALGIANVVWSLDSPRRGRLTRSELETVDLHLYFDTEELPAYAGLGAHRSERLSLAAGIAPLPGCGPSELARPGRQGPDLSFVGSLGEGRITELREFIRRVRPEDLAFLDELALEPGNAGHVFEQETGKPYAGVPTLYVDEVRTARRRIDFLAALPRSSLKIYGGSDWLGERSPLGDCYAGTVPYGPDLAAVYYHSKINVNVFHAQCIDSTNSRVYDVLAAGGFLLTEDRPVIHREFDAGRHLVTFSSPEDAKDKALYFLAHPEEREDIAREGQRHVLEHHTLRERFRTVLRLAEPFMGGAVDDSRPPGVPRAAARSPVENFST